MFCYEMGEVTSDGSCNGLYIYLKYCISIGFGIGQ